MVFSCTGETHGTNNLTKRVKNNEKREMFENEWEKFKQEEGAELSGRFAKRKWNVIGGLWQALTLFLH